MHQPVFTVHYLGPLDCVFVNEYLRACILVKCIYLFLLLKQFWLTCVACKLRSSYAFFQIPR